MDSPIFDELNLAAAEKQVTVFHYGPPIEESHKYVACHVENGLIIPDLAYCAG
ncbi:MAG: hypothetical protein AAFP69_08175 [Planctomycetota bacterium]